MPSTDTPVRTNDFTFHPGPSRWARRRWSNSWTIGRGKARLRESIRQKCSAEELSSGLRLFSAASSLELLPPNLYSLCRENFILRARRRAGSAKVVTNTSPGHIHVASVHRRRLITERPLPLGKAEFRMTTFCESIWKISRRERLCLRPEWSRAIRFFATYRK